MTLFSMKREKVMLKNSNKWGMPLYLYTCNTVFLLRFQMPNFFDGFAVFPKKKKET